MKWMMKASYESKLYGETTTQKLRDENGLSKKKFASSQRCGGPEGGDGLVKDREFDLSESIKNLEKDVQGHKKEIRRASASLCIYVSYMRVFHTHTRTWKLGAPSPPPTNRRSYNTHIPAGSATRPSPTKRSAFDLKRRIKN